MDQERCAAGNLSPLFEETRDQICGKKQGDLCLFAVLEDNNVFPPGQ